jgi:type VI protein secretion system component VasF
MIYVKSFLAAVAALIIYVVACGAIVMKLLTPKPLSFPADGVSYVSNGPWTPIPMWPVLIGALLVAAAAYYWTFKKIS